MIGLGRLKGYDQGDKELEDDGGRHELEEYVLTLEEAQLEEPTIPRTQEWSARHQHQMPAQSPDLGR